jgi:two-component system, OmpR family, sensor kinase
MRSAGEPNGSSKDKDRLIEKLREAVQARDEFFAMAVHELRNPITPVVLRLNTLLRKARSSGVPADMVADLEQLHVYVRNYVRRVTTLLDASRTLSGKLQLNPTETDLSQLTRQVIGQLGPIARHAGSQVIADLEDRIIGHWDPMALEQIIENLLSNALKYGSGRPVAISVSSNRESAQIIVRDQGIGISEADQLRIFGRFERAIKGGRRGGFGVGLWVVNQLVEAMGGAIEVQSAPGEGACFRVSLPIGTNDEGNQAP